MSRTKGVLYAVISASSFGLIPLFAMIAYNDGFNPYTFTLFRSIFATIEIFLLLKLKKINYTVEKKQLLPLTYASFFGYSLMMLTLVMSYNYIATGLATTLHFIYPVAVMSGCIFIFKEKVETKKILALLVAILGIYFTVGFGPSSTISSVGIILALVSGILYAVYVLIIAYSNISKLNSFVLAFYISLFNAFFLLIGSVLTGNMSLQFTYKGLLSTILVAFFCNVIGMTAFQAGVKLIGPATATILSTFEPLTSLIVGLLILNETLAWNDILGSLFIIISVVIVTLSEQNARKQKVDSQSPASENNLP